MDTNLVSYSQWQAVYAYAMNHDINLTMPVLASGESIRADGGLV